MILTLWKKRDPFTGNGWAPPLDGSATGRSPVAMLDGCRTAQVAVVLRGYTMDGPCVTEWVRRCTVETERAASPGKRPGGTAELNHRAELVLIKTIMEAQARGSRRLTLADLRAATGKLGVEWPFCGPSMAGAQRR